MNNVLLFIYYYCFIYILLFYQQYSLMYILKELNKSSISPVNVSPIKHKTYAFAPKFTNQR